MVVGIGRGQGEHSCVNCCDNVWVLWEVVDLLGMHVQNIPNMVTSSANH